MSGCPRCPSLGNAAHRSTAFWTAILETTLIPSCLHPYSFKTILAKRQVPTSLINTINNFFLCFKSSNRHFFFFLSQCKVFLSLHKEVPSSVWQLHLLGTQYCCVQEHLLLIKGVQLSLQSKVSVQTYFSRLPSGLSSQLSVFQVLNGLHSEKGPSVFCWCSDKQNFAEEGLLLSFSFPASVLREWLCWRKALCQTNWQRLLGLGKPRTLSIPSIL